MTVFDYSVQPEDSAHAEINRFPVAENTPWSFYHDPIGGHVYIGDKYTHHTDVAGQLSPEEYEKAVPGLYYPDSGNVDYYGPPGLDKDDAIQQIKEHFGPTEETWRFGANSDPQIIEHNREFPIHDEWEDGRRPILWHAGTNILHIGPPGSHHDELENAANEWATEKTGWIQDSPHHLDGTETMGNFTNDGKLHWYSGEKWEFPEDKEFEQMEPILNQALGNHLGIEAPEEGFHFGAIRFEPIQTEGTSHGGGHPFSYHPESQTLWLGGPGAFHNKLPGNFGNTLQGRVDPDNIIFYNSDMDGTDWDDNLKNEIMETLKGRDLHHNVGTYDALNPEQVAPGFGDIKTNWQEPQGFHFGAMPPPTIHESPKQWEDYEGVQQMKEWDPDEFADVKKNWAWRRPFIYDVGGNRVFVGQPGTHHGNLEEEYGLGEYAPEGSEARNKELPAGYIKSDEMPAGVASWHKPGDVDFYWNFGRDGLPQSYPHVLDALRREYITGEGQNGLTQVEPFHFGGHAPISVEHVDAEEWNPMGPQFSRRFIYDPENRVAYVGNPWSHHRQIFEATEDYGDEPQWSEGVVNPQLISMSPRLHPEDEKQLQQALYQHLGMEPETQWNFGPANLSMEPIDQSGTQDMHPGIQSSAPKVVEVDAKAPPSFKINDIKKRRGFVYHHPTDTTYLGQPGSYHSTIKSLMPVDPQTLEYETSDGFVDLPAQKVGVYDDDIPQDVRDNVHRYVFGEEPNEFRF